MFGFKTLTLSIGWQFSSLTEVLVALAYSFENLIKISIIFLSGLWSHHFLI